MISEGVEVSWFVQIWFMLEAKIGEDPLHSKSFSFETS